MTRAVRKGREEGEQCALTGWLIHNNMLPSAASLLGFLSCGAVIHLLISLELDSFVTRKHARYNTHVLKEQVCEQAVHTQGP